MYISLDTDKYCDPLDTEHAPRQTKPQLTLLQPKCGHESQMGSMPRWTD